ncbi:hypothetical protein T484DRAFT_2908953 [Baffinella frigidus]|nr:hypothetical protein T484DRAFT_2908953 [Cryptophyta sp. CCMP2293]
MGCRVSRPDCEVPQRLSAPVPSAAFGERSFGLVSITLISEGVRGPCDAVCRKALKFEAEWSVEEFGVGTSGCNMQASWVDMNKLEGQGSAVTGGLGARRMEGTPAGQYGVWSARRRGSMGCGRARVIGTWTRRGRAALSWGSWRAFTTTRRALCGTFRASIVPNASWIRSTSRGWKGRRWTSSRARHSTPSRPTTTISSTCARTMTLRGRAGSARSLPATANTTMRTRRIHQKASAPTLSLLEMRARRRPLFQRIDEESITQGRKGRETTTDDDSCVGPLRDEGSQLPRLGDDRLNFPHHFLESALE